jgi:hypothetical protein
MNFRFLLFLFLAGAFGPSAASAQSRPQPGDLYREFSRHNGGDRDWRVTDKNAVIKFERAKDHLPNSRLGIRIDDLQHAIGAEALLDRWGGHRGTINKRIRFNDHDWITVPEIKAVPADIRPEMLMFQDNPVVEVPLEHLLEGENIFDADCDEAGGFGWGQWGLYSLVLRVYYDREKKGDNFAISGEISSPASGQSIDDHPTIEVSAEAPLGVARIDVLAAYDGFDEDGDGIFDGWHESRFQLVRGEANEIRDHVGTLWKKPYRLIWNTHWVPDQKPGDISLIARIQDSRGYWYVSEPVADLSLNREDVNVRLYRARGVPEDFAVRVEETKECFFDIPTSDRISQATEAALHLRTWHGWDGHHEPLRINDHVMPVDGKNHFYDYDLLPFPPSALHSGENSFRIHSKTQHHMLEVLWPGPALVVRTPKPAVAIHDDRYQQRDHFVIETRRATYWLDKNSGGLSRLIDRDGHDWIAFKKEPWDQYPASAAGAYRGLPNLLFGKDESGFGHPGWDRASSEQVDESTIVSTSISGKWKLRWQFSAEDVRLTVEKADGDLPYWFLYEGPIAGRWSPANQYFAANTTKPINQPRDYFKGDKLFDSWRWVYFGDKNSPRVMFLIHEQQDDALDTFSHLGNSPAGLESPDGMVVFGFGRGPKGIKPLLSDKNSFRIGLLEQTGIEMIDYESISKQLNQYIETAKKE